MPHITSASARDNHAYTTLGSRIGAVLRWSVITLAALWIGLCTAVGPIYRTDGSISQWSWVQTLLFILVTALVLGIVIAVYHAANRNACQAEDQDANQATTTTPLRARAHATRIRQLLHTIGNYQLIQWIIHCAQRFARFAQSVTGNPRKVWITLLIGWLWAWIAFAVVMGADLFSQISEFTAFWQHAHGQELPYMKDGLAYQVNSQGVLSYATIMDVYPTAHYLWPDNPTFLTNHHNIVLTLLYGSVAYASQHVTGSVALGLILLALAQYVLCAWIVARTVVRFVEPQYFSISAMPEASATPEASSTPEASTTHSNFAASTVSATSTGASPLARSLILVSILNPAFAVSSLGLTKSPLFAASLIWWFGCCYQLYRAQHAGLRARDVQRRFFLEFTAATGLMLISAKYATPIIAVATITMLIAFKRMRIIPLLTMLLPLMVFQIALGAAIHTGAIINGDPIEGKSMQLLQISRTAARNPDAITPQLRKELAPIINVNQAGLAYNPQDADSVKSSGSNIHKYVAYQWTTVTEQDMQHFNSAWLALAKHAPVEYLDASLANSYGYFDIADTPYVSAFYYANNFNYAKVPVLDGWLGGIRHPVAAFLQGWSRVPVLGWPLHGNFWTVIALVVGACQIALRRWRLLSWQIVVLLLMGVMILAPANNFDRHMLPLLVIAPLMLWELWQTVREQHVDITR